MPLIDAITTNKTDFFREAGHFEFLTAKAMPDLAARFGTARKSLVWSAGCSSGEEPYTIAMVLNEYAQRTCGFRFGVLATDICTEVLAKAALGIFKSDGGAPCRRNCAASTSCAAVIRGRSKHARRARDCAPWWSSAASI